MIISIQCTLGCSSRSLQQHSTENIWWEAGMVDWLTWWTHSISPLVSQDSGRLTPGCCMKVRWWDVRAGCRRWREVVYSAVLDWWREEERETSDPQWTGVWSIWCLVCWWCPAESWADWSGAPPSREHASHTGTSSSHRLPDTWSSELCCRDSSTAWSAQGSWESWSVSWWSGGICWAAPGALYPAPVLRSCSHCSLLSSTIQSSWPPAPEPCLQHCKQPRDWEPSMHDTVLSWMETILISHCSGYLEWILDITSVNY